VEILGAREPYPPGLAVGNNSTTKFYRSPPCAGFFALASFVLGQGVAQKPADLAACGFRESAAGFSPTASAGGCGYFNPKTVCANVAIALCKRHDISQATLACWKKKTAGHRPPAMERPILGDGDRMP